MSVVAETERICLVADCGIEDAEVLLSVLNDGRGRPVDVSAARHLHAAIVQILIAHEATLTGTPDDAFLAQWVLPAIKKTL
jgi:hypothetical protein